MNNTSVCVSMLMKKNATLSLQHSNSEFYNKRGHGLGKSGSEAGPRRSPAPKSVGNGEEEGKDGADASAGRSTSAERGWSATSCCVRGSVCLCASAAVRLSLTGAWMLAMPDWESLDSWTVFSGLRLEPWEEWEQRDVHSEPSENHQMDPKTTPPWCPLSYV